MEFNRVISLSRLILTVPQFPFEYGLKYRKIQQFLESKNEVAILDIHSKHGQSGKGCFMHLHTYVLTMVSEP